MSPFLTVSQLFLKAIGQHEEGVFRKRAAEDAAQHARESRRTSRRPRELSPGPAGLVTLDVTPAPKVRGGAPALPQVVTLPPPQPAGGLFAVHGGAGAAADSDALSTVEDDVLADDDSTLLADADAGGEAAAAAAARIVPMGGYLI